MKCKALQGQRWGPSMCAHEPEISFRLPTALPSPAPLFLSLTLMLQLSLSLSLLLGDDEMISINNCLNRGKVAASA